MANDDKQQPSGKRSKDDKFFAVKTDEEAHRQIAEAIAHNKPEAISLSAYFVSAKITDVVLQAAMEAFTTVRRATPDDWKQIFAKF